MAMMPHLAQLAQRIEQGWASGLLWAGERNVTMEALLAVAAHSPDPAIQSQARASLLHHSVLKPLHG